MLVQFVVKNFMSFRDETVFRMTSTTDARHEEHIIRTEGQKASLLKTSSIYGANASGKTNLVRALQFLKTFLLKGQGPKQGIPVKRFRLDPKSSEEPASFEIEILHEDVHYSYGIKINETYVLEEWLFVTRPNGREVMFFERLTNEKGIVQIEFGPQLKQDAKPEFLEFVAQGTRPEQPFLTEAELRNVKAINPLMEWFRNALTILDTNTRFLALPLRIQKDRDFTKQLGNFLSVIGTGIEDIKTDESDLDFDKHFPELRAEVRQNILSDLAKKIQIFIETPNEDWSLISGTSDQPKIAKIRTVHRSVDGSQIPFSLSDESSGTKRIIHLFPTLFNMSKKVFVIDELDRSLHPLLSRRFIEFFLKNSKCCQLIFTTHEECLLDLEIFRRDEIWFVEKDPKTQSSHCYPLTDFKIRPDLEIRKGYLNGRFGAIPFFGDPKSLGW